ncbi:helicase HerA-like domain-containing protein [Arenimonas sp. GDDSR-1]|uniref:helicase HerA-like domain-containing protein n=1 Tax=Arenimonas sp. GDDSR-1 TaxID=2950125 RepID=UPI0026346D8E|nr:helicase HerA-like domain-containing protein [Arenimonas sp. GDDSR-1]
MSDILIGKGEQQVSLLAKYGNRHGLVAGATGTGKSVSLMVLAEGFSRMGVPVFMADVKGDIAGLAIAGTMNEKIQSRVTDIGIPDYVNEASPVAFWDLYGKKGHPVRTTVSEFGPDLFARVLELNETQAGVLDIAFKLADDDGLLLLDLEDLRAVLNHVAESKTEVSAKYGLVSPASVAAIQRALLRLEQQGGEHFFGEPALQLSDIMQRHASGRGMINLLTADQLILQPRLYSSFLLWLLSELFETLPEVGDLEQPKLVFFFDEAHLLFGDIQPALLQRVEQVVRLVRSKGVGVYFCSQNPDDIPDNVLGQLGNRIQHALRAYTPRDQKAVRTAAETFVPNPKIDVAKVISELAVGEALVSTLQDKGIPMPVERAIICPPRCRMGALTDAERQAVLAQSLLGAKYDQEINRESAREKLNARVQNASPADQGPAKPEKTEKAAKEEPGFLQEILFGNGRRQGVIEQEAKYQARKFMRGILGGLLGKKR